VLKHAQQNGWEAFEIAMKKKDKSTGETTKHVTQMPASVCSDGVYYYDGVTDKNGKPKTIIQRDAMTLSKLYWSNMTQSGLRKDLYEAFEAQYVPLAALESSLSSLSAIESSVESDSEPESVATAPAPVAAAAAASAAAPAEKKPRAKRTESQKAATADTKAKNKEAAAAAASASSAAASASSASDADEKEEPVVSTPVKAKKAKKADTDAPKKPKAPKKAKKGEWSCEDDGEFHSWSHEGDNYLRNFAGHIFKASETGEVTESDWVGVWNNDTKEIDVTYSIPEEYVTA